MIYLDNAATTKTADEVIGAMLPFFREKYGNPSSAHSFGRVAAEELEKSREVIASKINAKPEEVFFTSSGTESNNWSIKEVMLANSDKGNHFITSQIEHESVLECAKFLEGYGSKADYIGVDCFGIVNIEELQNKITKDTVLASIMHANNEIGTIQDIKEIGKICREKDILFHTDACQSFCKEEIDVKKMNIDLMSLNAHKIHGPRGIGALFVREGVKISPLIHGGGQESGLRSGTANVAGAAGFAKAVEIYKKDDVAMMAKLRDTLIDSVLQISDARLNGHPAKRLCNNANFSFKLIEGGVLMDNLAKNSVIVSTGSACTSKSLEPSHVLKAIGLQAYYLHGAIRITFGRYNSEDEVEKCADVIRIAVNELRKC